jgi:Cysteine rich repeat
MRAFLSAVLMAAVLMPLGLRPASAQIGDILPALLAQCHRDAAELCSDVEPGGLRIAACLYSRLNDLSPGCQRAMRDGIAMRACGSDYYRYCREVPVGEGRVAGCLREFRDEVSPRCSEALAFGAPRDDYRRYGRYDDRRYGYSRYGDRRYDDRRYDDRAAKASPAPYVRRYQDPAPEDDDRGPDDLK